jgi:hypothetical protein
LSRPTAGLQRIANSSYERSGAFGPRVNGPRWSSCNTTSFAPDPHPPKEVIDETDPDHPRNVEQRDYLQVENDVWNARKRIGGVPVRLLTVDYSNIAESPAERRNVKDQRGWLVLSPGAKQIVVHTGHGIVYDDPDHASEIILDVVMTARSRNGSRTLAG